MKKGSKILRLFFLLCFSFSALASRVTADELSDYGITIVKYKMDSSQITANNLPTQPSGSDLGETVPKANSGEVLSVFPGVRYNIEKVNLKNGSNQDFEIAPDNVTQMITTDSNGRAHLLLSEGIYRITEQSSSLIPNPAAPIVIQLPTTLQNGNKVNQVYIYPKSSLVRADLPNGNSTPPSNTKPYSFIPQTSGNLSSVIPLYILLGGVLFIGLLGVIISQKKLHNKQ